MLAGPVPSKSMDYTGERMVPEAAEVDVFWEHVYRYRFARKFVDRRCVLDVASGEGYGSYGLLKAGAAKVIGIDISEEACAHARQKYGIDARCGSGTQMPIADESVDLIVSFETIEHISRPADFVHECARVLRRDGHCIVSTPNRETYSKGGSHNSFHCSEMSESEFIDILSTRFRRIRMFGQSFITALPWHPRSLAATRSAWRRMRGYWFARRMMSRGALWTRLDDRLRTDPALSILLNENLRSTVFNPYQVRRRSRISGERPLYLIAVCGDPIK
jgi:SAM-dependent methyltransferase